MTESLPKVLSKAVSVAGLDDQVLQTPPDWKSELNLHHSPELHSVEERYRQVNKIVGYLYEWYMARSQTRRIWQVANGKQILKPDGSTKIIPIFWDRIRKIQKEVGDGGLEPKIGTILGGFADVEYYAADYASTILRMLRELAGGSARNYARVAFNQAWGGEEQKHADAWMTAVKATNFRTSEEADARAETMHDRGEFQVPPDSIFEMAMYVVAQELATGVSYGNFGKMVSSKNSPNYDPELAKIASFIQVDESAHYYFFLEVANVLKYYFPAESVQAIVNVTNPDTFSMPASHSIPLRDYRRFNITALSENILNRGILVKDVFAVCLKQLGEEDREKWVNSLKNGRKVEEKKGQTEETAVFTTDQLVDTFLDAMAKHSALIINEKLQGVRELYKSSGQEGFQTMPKDLPDILN